MRTTKFLVRTTEMVAGAIGAVAVVGPERPASRVARRLAIRLSRDVRYAVASAPGVLYRLAGRRPDPTVDDNTLADRVRSSLGPLEHRLGVPRVHVMVEDHVVLLHGEAPDLHTSRAIEHAVKRISGVRGVESHLHTGLVRGSICPCEYAREGS